ncbi:MAG: hypothetical protein WCQ64_15085, partial [Acidobacteriota bacterium]
RHLTHASLTRYMINLSPLGEEHARARAESEAAEVVASPERLRQLLEHSEEIELKRSDELAGAAAELGELKDAVRSYMHSPTGRTDRVIVAVRALIYLRDPFDAVLDQHRGMGLEDDCQVIREAARAMSL